MEGLGLRVHEGIGIRVEVYVWGLGSRNVGFCRVSRFRV